MRAKRSRNEGEAAGYVIERSRPKAEHDKRAKRVCPTKENATQAPRPKCPKSEAETKVRPQAEPESKRAKRVCSLHYVIESSRPKAEHCKRAKRVCVFI